MVRQSPFLPLLLCATVAIAPSAWAAPAADFSRTDIAFSYQTRGAPSPDQPVFITNTGDAPLHVTAVMIAGGQARDYGFGGTCGPPVTLLPGERCRIDVVLTAVTGLDHPTAATLTVTTDATPPSQDISLAGIVDPGNGTVLATPLFVPTPEWLDFPAQPVGSTSAPRTLVINTASVLSFTVNRFALLGKDAADFTLTSDCSIGQMIAHNQTCTANVVFHPRSSGPRSTELSAIMTFRGIDGDYRYSITGVGAGDAQPVTVVEYYNAVLDHYFITWIAAEQANLDAGNTPTRWNRTGYSFRAYALAQAGTSPVCRYYLPPLYGDSHFFGRGTAECDATGAAHPAFVLEDPLFMHVFLPTAGVCAAGTTPIYRVFSNRADANHRYMTDRAVRDQMVARGWLAEGDGPDLVVMCGV